jgi:DNA repair exonuclease SbcCD ATPase subunit
MKLLSMKLENFQGVKALSLEFPDGCSGTIYGDNGTGKTTVYNALTWLLFDKASTGTKDFSPKTKGAGGEDLHHLNHGVTASFRQETGQITTFQKVYHEVYKKKRGSAYEERDGHTVDYFVDGVPVRERDYTSTVLSLCGGDAEKPKMLTMPDYFAEQLKWQTRRQILLEICGDVSDTEIINSSDELLDLPTYLMMPGTSDRKYGIDEYKKIAGSRLKELNKQLEGIPGRIEEAEKAIPDTGGSDLNTVNAAIEAGNRRIAELMQEKASAKSGSTTESEIRKEIADVELKIANGRLSHARMEWEKNGDRTLRITEAERHLAVCRMCADNIGQDRVRKRKKLDELIETREKIMQEWHRVKAESFQDSAKICPTCGRELPADKLEKIISDFNLSKSRRLAQLNMQGKSEASKDMIERLKTELQEIEETAVTAADAIDEAERKLEEARNIVNTPVPYEQTDEYAELTSKIAQLKEKLLNTEKYANEVFAEIDSKIESEKRCLAQYEEMRIKLTIAETQRKRVSELEDSEVRLTSEYGKTERGLYLCDLFMRAKVDMLTERINRKFRRVRFRLFEVQQNGGLKEGCDVMVPTDDGRLVPYAIANNAARINAGLEIIDTLSEHWGVKLPVVVDNAESITRLAKIGTQMIRLVVSEPDKVLRLEVEE